MLGAVNHPEFFDHNDVEAYIIYVAHTSFQLYHCHFPRNYLYELYHNDEPSIDSEGVILNHTRGYDFSDEVERGEGLDVFVVLVKNLVGGELKVGSFTHV